MQTPSITAMRVERIMIVVPPIKCRMRAPGRPYLSSYGPLTGAPKRHWPREFPLGLNRRPWSAPPACGSRSPSSPAVSLLLRPSLRRTSRAACWASTATKSRTQSAPVPAVVVPAEGRPTLGGGNGKQRRYRERHHGSYFFRPFYPVRLADPILLMSITMVAALHMDLALQR
jgi:hypothetical protein